MKSKIVKSRILELTEEEFIKLKEISSRYLCLISSSENFKDLEKAIKINYMGIK